MNFQTTHVKELKPLPSDEEKLSFGKYFTDHMLKINYSDNNWTNGRIEPFGPLSLSPAALVLHYGQEIFEGMKAFRQVNDKEKISLFRPDKNAKRFNLSAERMCMPTIEEEVFVESIKAIIREDKRWVPYSEGTSLYIRPTMIATEEALGVHPSSEYLFYVILCSVGSYFPEGFKPTKIFVEDKYVRAVQGGTGEAKTGGNYAASLFATKRANNKGYSQVLWLDAKDHSKIEEVGAMNQFFVINNELYTAPLKGTVLRGVTRESVIQLAQDKGYKVNEESITISEVIEASKTGALQEAFGAGTAASIAPVGELYYKGTAYVINNNQVGKITQELYESLIGIQTGKIEDPYGWNVEI
jgi:branched-chain amino acid aminotransferase